MKKIFIVAIIIFLLCLSAFSIFSTKVKADSLYTNFESGLGGWETFTRASGSLVQISTTYAHSGVYSVEQIAQSSGSEPLASVGGIKLPVSSILSQYELSAWIYVTARSDAHACSALGFDYENESVAWNVWAGGSSYVYVRQSEGYTQKGNFSNPVPYGLTLNMWHQFKLIVYTSLGTVSVWLDGGLIVDNWPSFNAGQKPDYYEIACVANRYGTFVMHQYVDDVYVSEIAPPPSVGGKATPIDKIATSSLNDVAFLAQYVIATATTILAVSMSVAYIKRRKKQ